MASLELIKHGALITGKVIKSHLPEILTGISVVSQIAQPFVTMKAAYKIEKVKAEMKENGEDPTWGKVLEKTWYYYIPIAATAGTGIVSGVAGMNIALARNAALTTAAAASAKALYDYREEAKGLLGEKKEQKILDTKNAAIAEKTIATGNFNPAVMAEGDGKILCIDGSFTGRPFRATYEDIRAAVNTINFNLAGNLDGEATLNDFFDYIGDRMNLTPVDAGDTFGWTSENPLVVEYSSVLYQGNRPCCVINYNLFDLKTGQRVL